MKKNDWAIVAGTIAYSLLFYKQNAGLNFLLFSVFLVTAFAFLNPKALRHKYWWLISCCILFSGVCIFMYGSALAIFANIAGLILLPAFTFNANTSVIVSMFYGFYSVGGSIAFILAGLVSSPAQSEERSKREAVIKFVAILVPLVIALIFFFIYKNANPLFEKYTSFISGEWILFTLGGLFLVFGLVRHERIKGMDKWEMQQTDLNRENFPEENPMEKKAFVLLFVLLNTMLLFINALDVNYLYLGAGMPADVTHKQFVHHGVGMLILSILLGIGTILYFFRGALNFSNENKLVKWLVYGWLLQNLLMVFSTGVRNHLYIGDALLTYKRIGVYCWLLLAAIGLITTAIKIYKAKAVWYLLRANSLVVFLILTASAALDWDKFISDYNLKHAKTIASLDKRYLISLSEANTVQLYALRNDKDFNTDSVYHYEYHRQKSFINTAALDFKLYNLLRHHNNSWQSLNLRNDRAVQDVSAICASKESFDFTGNYITSLQPLFRFRALREIKLEYFDERLYKEFYRFPRLEKISFAYTDKKGVEQIKKLRSFKTIHVKTASKTLAQALRGIQNVVVEYSEAQDF